MIKKNKGGRPPIEGDLKRFKRVTINLTEEEYKTLTKKSERLKTPISTLSRKAVTGVKLPQHNENLPEMLRILAGMANNLNQIAKHLNQGYTADEKISRQLEMIQSAISIIADEFLGED